jgi:hypothetical protein
MRILDQRPGGECIISKFGLGLCLAILSSAVSAELVLLISRLALPHGPIPRAVFVLYHYPPHQLLHKFKPHRS